MGKILPGTGGNGQNIAGNWWRWEKYCRRQVETGKILPKTRGDMQNIGGDEQNKKKLKLKITLHFLILLPIQIFIRKKSFILVLDIWHLIIQNCKIIVNQILNVFRKDFSKIILRSNFF